MLYEKLNFLMQLRLYLFQSVRSAIKFTILTLFNYYLKAINDKIKYKIKNIIIYCFQKIYLFIFRLILSRNVAYFLVTFSRERKLFRLCTNSNSLHRWSSMFAACSEESYIDTFRLCVILHFITPPYTCQK